MVSPMFAGIWPVYSEEYDPAAEGLMHCPAVGMGMKQSSEVTPSSTSYLQMKVFLLPR